MPQWTSFCFCSLETNPGIDQRIRDIDQEIHEQIPDGRTQDNGLHLRVLEAKNPIQTVFTKTRNHEDLLGDDRSAKESASLNPRTVTTGISALRRACLEITGRSESPLARAVRT